ncbi:histidine--tRNA ligase [Saccharolobus islandicus]|uniref:Histidine--tRNA ligase n=3 Tax=Saccharolobus islandicus TaxID=43080 RepID=SYH_SACI2|nr:histidine--tRNA ligase [Sulfolobus islandicus]C3MRE4.1 RecName: Full=Histidine--tRNA ligase; AltName: Full=Histidyl-tRNA synthetase; Short=HisRS [Sulfolobus islandicus L.S.2.15]C3MY40.1 RecName: Full=Histidine--tRNA ligase; AltName: Full=Histidyl-tRNA synthetase; Short=HisRS [Sulfolobus islandicus M.14.25]C4KIQ9.1 RecName: Full=Histidine--tRNA ligase; AltName: Full=Histidyl-tRNA synthetase; Short=HisRS [Sulfolobus islandicus M.16.4]ACP35957.1 histidyl-tRNA synthetase [Sulfolobus islandicus L
MTKFETVRGMKDYIGIDAEKIRYLESTFRDLAIKYGYSEIITPVVEEFKLFALKGGEELRETMYVFKDKADRELSLRPEITPSVARAYIQNLQSSPKPIRLFYFGTVYRYDEPQYGRYREFRQAGIEMIGDSSILADLEVLDLLYNFYDKLNLSNDITIKINNIGIFRKIMDKYNIEDNLQEHILHLIDKNKINEALDILEKNLKNKDIIDFFNKILTKKDTKLEDIESLAELEEVSRLDIKSEFLYLFRLSRILSNLNIKFKIDLGFVRGLAYYTGLIFEVLHPSVQFSIAGGGRYDKLIELYGGLPSPAIGFAIGVERTLLVIKDLKVEEPVNVIVIGMSEDTIPSMFMVSRILRKEEYKVVINTKDQPLSKLLPYYASQGFKVAIIIGKQELEKNMITVRNLITRKQISVPLENIEDAIKQTL